MWIEFWLTLFVFGRPVRVEFRVASLDLGGQETVPERVCLRNEFVVWQWVLIGGRGGNGRLDIVFAGPAVDGASVLVAWMLLQATRVLSDLGHEVCLAAAFFCYEGGGAACGTRRDVCELAQDPERSF